LLSFQSRVVAVGQDVDPLSLMWRANFSRTEYSRRCSVTHSFQCSQDILENGFTISRSAAKNSFDIFEKDN
jgi:hypothetical protein